MTIDFNDASEQRAEGVIPDGTYCGLRMTLRPGGENVAGMPADDLGLFKASMRSDVHYLDIALTVISGPHSGRKLFQNLTVAGGQVTEAGVSKGWNVTKDLLRAMIDSACGLDPKDMSAAAKAKRVMPSFRSLDGIEFFAKIGVERGGEAQGGGTYPDKNRIAHVVVPGEPQYAELRAGKVVAPAPSQSSSNGAAAPRPASAQPKPAWQQETPAASPAATAQGPSWLRGEG